MGWAGLTLVTDAEIATLEPDSVTWGTQGVWTSQRSNAKRDLKVLLELAYPEIPGVADRVLDKWAPELVFTYTSSAYTDKTVEAKDEDAEDIDLAAALATFGTDRIYVGAAWEFDGLYLSLLDSFNANVSALTAKYWGPAGWTSLVSTDGTLAAATKTLSGSGRVTWVMPTAWARRTLNNSSDEYYWVELSVSAALTAGTAASQILPIKAPDGLKTVAQYFALMHILRGLAAQSPNPGSWLERSKEYEDRARMMFTEMKDKGAIPIDYNEDEVIDPDTETAQPRPVRLYRG